jgi:uncharacterized caspase-like protein
MFRYAFVIVGFLSIVSSFEAVAASRVALVIGNESYTSLSPLSNPALDATAIARVLGDHGFEVKLYKNLDYREFEKAVADFVAFSQGAEEAVVFYAGHGMSVVEDGRIINVLAATDAVMDGRTRRAQKVVGLEEIVTKREEVRREVAGCDGC